MRLHLFIVRRPRIRTTFDTLANAVILIAVGIIFALAYILSR